MGSMFICSGIPANWRLVLFLCVLKSKNAMVFQTVSVTVNGQWYDKVNRDI